MSTNLHCEMHERTPGEWFYVLEHGATRENAPDWREYASAYGPFRSMDACLNHLQQHHANPGGFTTFPYSEGRKEDEILKRLLDEAPQRKKELDGFGSLFFGGSS